MAGIRRSATYLMNRATSNVSRQMGVFASMKNNDKEKEYQNVINKNQAWKKSEIRGRRAYDNVGVALAA